MLKPLQSKMGPVKAKLEALLEALEPLKHKIEMRFERTRLQLAKINIPDVPIPEVVKSRAFRRVATILASFIFTVVFITLTVQYTNAGLLIPKVISGIMPKFPTCDHMNHKGTPELWEKSQKKYEKLMDNKFTIAMQTYRRPKELENTLNILLSEDIPSLEEIVIVWNDLENAPPENYVSKRGVPVRYRKSKHNSLNEKFLPDPEYKTQAILLSDDDVYYHPSDLEFVFQTWRKFGRNRITGAVARCSPVDMYGYHQYDICSNRKGEDEYSMILTNLAFSHISFLDYYHSNDTTMNQLRTYVDEGLNCEDIAFNFVQSLLTGEGPLLVNGHQKYANFIPREGISRKTGHMEAKTECLNDFSKIMGCHPLHAESAYIQRGVIVT
ncbi:hypothetical protein NM208_g3622 [Fusarium decemcellulare]|uniref:Uncharacterized protein n=1 Tax=Fusarium decemcellulare TaxID=57161 RepID=A0ACC1SNE3_9HYPO|nr:hypothetical protein NM208_g3622 [Fusarium decemcellulare]